MNYEVPITSDSDLLWVNPEFLETIPSILFLYCSPLTGFRITLICYYDRQALCSSLSYDLRKVTRPGTFDTSFSYIDERPVILTADGGAFTRLFDVVWPEGFVLGYFVEGSNTELYLFMIRQLLSPVLHHKQYQKINKSILGVCLRIVQFGNRLGNLIISIIQDHNMKFRQFLTRLSELTSKQVSPYVIGNSSVDYDSFFGSIILAYILSITSGNLHRPIIDCSRKDLNLRFEITAILQKVNIDLAGLQFQDDVEKQYPNGLYNLYDHNIRAGIQKIKYIVDHHMPEENRIKGEKQLIVNPMGSGLTILYYLLAPSRLEQVAATENTTSQFVQQYHKFVDGEHFMKFKKHHYLDQDLNIIIRYGILIDSYNFDVKQKGRWTIFDQNAVNFIQGEQKFDEGFDWIENVKFDQQRNKKLTLEQSLKKDRKYYTYGKLNAAYSVIYLSPDIYFDQYGQQIRETLDENYPNIDLYFLMYIYKDENGNFKREIMYKIKGNDQSIQTQLKEVFSSLESSIGMIEKDKIGDWNRYEDPSVSISRKKFEPLVSAAFQKAKL